MPNSRLQAEQRAAWLKRKLEKSPKLLDDYKGFVEDIVAKGYVREVSPHGLFPIMGFITLISLGKFVSSLTVQRSSKENP